MLEWASDLMSDLASDAEREDRIKAKEKVKKVNWRTCLQVSATVLLSLLSNCCTMCTISKKDRTLVRGVTFSGERERERERRRERK